MDGNEIEQMLDRRFRDFREVVDTRLTGIQGGLETMNSTLLAFVQKVTEFPNEYVPRRDIEKDNEARDITIKELKAKVERLEKWKNTLMGAIALTGFLIGVASHVFKL